MVFNNGVRTASFLRIIKAFNFDLVGEELFYFCNVLHKCTAAINIAQQSVYLTCRYKMHTSC